MASVATWILTGCGVALVLIGGFFLLARPPLLPEDARFMGSAIEEILAAVPALAPWLRRVFWVLGGYVVTTGVLVAYVATTGVRAGSGAALTVLAVAGVTSLWLDVRGQRRDSFGLQVGAARPRLRMGTRIAAGPGGRLIRRPAPGTRSGGTAIGSTVRSSLARWPSWSVSR